METSMWAHTNGLILLGSLSNLAIASRMLARSTIAGTPVKSYEQEKQLNKLLVPLTMKKSRMKKDITCRRTRAGLNGISTDCGEVFSQSIIFSTSFLLIWKPSQLRIADSRRIRIEYGNLSVIYTRTKHPSCQQQNLFLLLPDMKQEIKFTLKALKTLQTPHGFYHWFILEHQMQKLLIKLAPKNKST